MRPVPERAYFVPWDTVLYMNSVATEAYAREEGLRHPHGAVQVRLRAIHRTTFIEADSGVGILVHVVDPEVRRSDGENVKLRLYGAKRKAVGEHWHTAGAVVRVAADRRYAAHLTAEGYQSIVYACRLLAALGYLGMLERRDMPDEYGLLDDAPEPREGRPEVRIRRGDTVRYVRAPLVRLPPQARDVQTDEIIRRREHAVRGHWRILRSGARVWVRSHRRGDDALGTVQTNYEIGTIEKG